MRTNMSDIAKASVAPRIAKSFKFSWLIYGAAAYFGIRYLNRKGILPKQTDAALNLMNKGVDYAKSQLGLGTGETSVKRSQSEQNQSGFNRPSMADDTSLRH